MTWLWTYKLKFLGLKVCYIVVERMSTTISEIVSYLFLYACDYDAQNEQKIKFKKNKALWIFHWLFFLSDYSKRIIKVKATSRAKAYDKATKKAIKLKNQI